LNDSVTASPIPLEQLHPGDNLLQSSYWARVKAGEGWDAQAFRLDVPKSTVCQADTFDGADDDRAYRVESETLLVLTRRLASRRKLAYVPHGPSERFAGEGLGRLAQALRHHLPGECFLVRFDPRWEKPSSNPDSQPDGPAEAKSKGCRKEELREATGGAGIGPTSWKRRREGDRSLVLRPAAGEIQPIWTVLVDLDPEPKDVLARMKSKWRYNIRLAYRRGVAVYNYAGGEALERIEDWYRLYEETAERDRIAIHRKDYYARFFRETGPGAPRVELTLAYHEGELLAGIVTARQGARSTYLFGASASHKRNLMASYAVQWEAMVRARQAGALVYDLYGIPPSADADHPMHGLYRFKTGFGGRIVRRPGPLDVAYRPVSARAFRSAERLRAYYYKRIRKRR